MRVLFPVLATSLFAMGCAEEPVVLNQHTGTLNARTNGVTLFEDSFVGFVGMEGTTCGVDTLSGETLDDVDLPGDDEVVHDNTGTDDDGSIVLTSTKEGIYTIDPSVGSDEFEGGWDEMTEEAPAPDFALQGITDAQFMDDTIVAVHQTIGGCAVSFLDANASPETVSTAACSDTTTLSVAPSRSTVYVSSDEGVLAIHAGNATAMNLSANLLAWDASTDALYAAVEDSNVVRAVEADGQLRFEVELEGAVHDIQAIGNKGLMGVVTSYGKDSHRSGGHFMTIDGYTGAITSSQSIPQAASFEVSKDGKRLAFVLDHTVHFFDMN